MLVLSHCVCVEMLKRGLRKRHRHHRKSHIQMSGSPLFFLGTAVDSVPEAADVWECVTSMQSQRANKCCSDTRFIRWDSDLTGSLDSKLSKRCVSVCECLSALKFIPFLSLHLHGAIVMLHGCDKRCTNKLYYNMIMSARRCNRAGCR